LIRNKKETFLPVVTTITIPLQKLRKPPSDEFLRFQIREDFSGRGIACQREIQGWLDIIYITSIIEYLIKKYV